MADRRQVMNFRIRAQQLDRARGTLDDTAVLDIGVQASGPDGANWALAVRGVDVAASLSQFSLTARLAFLVVGPMVDLKLFAMQAGTFGRAFALRFAPATFVLALLVAAAVGAVLL